ncbi:hypothetical protein [Microvirga sp. VF16]|uniref:hypothetical protein n=1 Tax=Microvirga sp. VF16 TaxID=2807101 RepID=UPI00193E244E|nr:hypothetical protein [Microvirga sp. VF16]QRM36058.1 hypothetical protein JO965_45625 [Microvirga sp. VF16]
MTTRSKAPFQHSDKPLKIGVGNGNLGKIKKLELMMDKLGERLAKPVRDNVTDKQYTALPKECNDALAMLEDLGMDHDNGDDDLSGGSEDPTSLFEDLDAEKYEDDVEALLGPLPTKREPSAKELKKENYVTPNGPGTPDDGVKVSDRDLEGVVTVTAMKKRFHPVRDALERYHANDMTDEIETAAALHSTEAHVMHKAVRKLRDAARDLEFLAALKIPRRRIKLLLAEAQEVRATAHKIDCRRRRLMEHQPPTSSL